MSTESPSGPEPSNRMFNLASIGLLAVAIFGLARLGFGVVPVWILAVPFVLLACMDIENRFARIDSIATRFGVIAFHFVIVATVVAAHQQIGGIRDSGYKMQHAGYGRGDTRGIAANAETGGCGAGGGCGGSDGCGGACGTPGGTAAGAEQGGRSGCGCGGGTAVGSSRSPNSKRSAPPVATTAAQRAADGSPVSPPQASLKLPPRLPALPNLPLSAGSTQPKIGGEIKPPLALKSPATPPSPPLVALPPQAPDGQKTKSRAQTPASVLAAPTPTPSVPAASPSKHDTLNNPVPAEPGTASKPDATPPPPKP